MLLAFTLEWLEKAPSDLRTSERVKCLLIGALGALVDVLDEAARLDY